MVAVLKYGGGFSSTETQLISFRIVDTLYQPMLLNAMISNPNGAISTRYSPFDEIEIVETTSVLGETTNLILFRGKIENISIPTHPKYGQVIELNARDNLQELAKRTMRDGAYSANGRGGTSGLLKEIIEDHTATAANIDITNASTLLASTDTYSKSATYKNSGKTALRAITDEAQQDPWGATSIAADNSGFAFYLDSALDFNYHKLGTVPSAPASNGLTVQYGLTAPTVTAQPMMAGSSFNEPGRQVVTHCNAVWTDAGGVPRQILLQRWTHGTVTFAPFYANNEDSGEDSNQGGARLLGSGGLVGRVQYVEDGAILVSHVDGEGSVGTANMPPLWFSGETVTQQAGITPDPQPFASVTTTPFLKTGMIIEKTVQSYDFVDTETEKAGRLKAIEAAATVLRKGFAVEGLVEGTLKIIGYPEHKQSSTWYQVRAGQQIKVTNTGTANINDNMTVKRIQYEQGPGRMDSTIDVVSVTEGNDYIASSSAIRLAVSSGERTTAAIGQIPAALAGAGGTEAAIHLRPYAGSNVRTSVEWSVGSVSFSDGSTQGILSGQSSHSGHLNGQFSDTKYPTTGAAASTLPYVMYIDMARQANLIKMAAMEPTGSPSDGTTDTLDGSISAAGTTVVLDDSTGFVEGNFVRIDEELIQLGSLSTHTFSNCVRARASAFRTKANPHNDGVVVTLVTLTYDGTFIVPVEVLGTSKLVIAIVHAGSKLAGATGSDADPAKIFMTSSTNFGNQVT